MHITFATKQVRDMCEKGQLAVRRFGPPAASALKGFIADLEVASLLEDLPYPRSSQSGVETFTLDDGLQVVLSTDSASLKDVVSSIRIEKVQRA